AAGHQPVVVLAVDQIHLAAKVTLLAVDEAGGIAERDGGEGVGRHDLRSFSNTLSRTARTQDRRKNDVLNNPPTRTWKSMLPVPGSRYPQRCAVDSAVSAGPNDSRLSMALVNSRGISRPGLAPGL